MSSKIDVDIVHSILRQKLDDVISAEIMVAIAEALKEEKNEKTEKPEKEPKKWVVMVMDNDHALPENLVGFVFQVPENLECKTMPDRLQRVADKYHTTKGGKKLPAGTVGDLCSWAPKKLFTEHGLTLKTRDVVEIVPMPNQLK
jgi:hypothetical protein